MKKYSTGNDNIDKGIAVAGTIAVLYLGNKLLDTASNFFTPGSKKDNEENKAVEDVKVTTSKLQYLPTVYKRIAQQQYDAMNLPGTDEDTLFDTLKGLNTEDLKQVYKDYGRRSPRTNLTGSEWLDEFGSPSDLITWYREELDQEELKKMQAIWAGTQLF